MEQSREDWILNRDNFPFGFFLSPCRGERGFSLIEVMLAMVILAGSLLGVLGLFQWADRGIRQGSASSQALALAVARLEYKRVVPWNALLNDDVDGDGTVDLVMRDDGTQGDRGAGDGIYTASVVQNGVHLVWTLEPDQPGPWYTVGSVAIRVKATYGSGSGKPRNLELGTLRANPNYVGIR